MPEGFFHDLLIRMDGETSIKSGDNRLCKLAKKLSPEFVPMVEDQSAKKILWKSRKGKQAIYIQHKHVSNILKVTRDFNLIYELGWDGSVSEADENLYFTGRYKDERSLLSPK